MDDMVDGQRTALLKLELRARNDDDDECMCPSAQEINPIKHTYYRQMTGPGFKLQSYHCNQLQGMF